ncbi:2,3-bisphosphoglycerate-independent phosphoglycerate mutase [Halobacterium hubeiense]|uniref:2,3-bisphosphoglycerate-independent phosphoglycerate mutase n=1 Tax=Halobacterium hubeiense TaxID=1407499 RepID=UPI003C723B79
MQAALVILDGWGLADHDRLDAVEAADTPTFDEYARRGGFGTLTTHGREVGLPRGQMGNSEVGHLTIGSGRVVLQEYTRINDAIADGDLCENDAISDALDHVERTGGRVHFLGLVSDGGVHSDHEHLHALIECAASRDLPATTHAFTDGRDTAPHGGENYLQTLREVTEEYDTGDVATVIGRYYAMDRDQNWERTKRAYDAIVHRDADHHAESAVDAVRESYDRGDTDEFVEPTTVEGGAALEEGDAVVCFNFRADRARQLVRMLADVRPEDWESEGVATDPPEVPVATMTEYDETFDLPVAFESKRPADTLGEVLAEQSLTQLRVAESEKYPHVTYFLNGGREVEFEGERREIVESPDVPTYDLAPEMSAAGVTDVALDVLESDDPDVLVLNYANPDMVGHTGDYEAAIEAVETVDGELGRLVPALRESGADVLVTADHGNADDMGTREDPHTAHTFNPVPFVHLPAAERDEGSRDVREDGALRDVAPTVLSLLGVEQPAAMTGDPLLE